MDSNRSIQDEVEEEQIEDNVTVEERLEHLNLDEELENDEVENDEVENDAGSDYDNDDDDEDYDNNNNNNNNNNNSSSNDNDDDDYEDEDEDEIDAYEGEEVDEVIPVSVVMSPPRVSNSVSLDSEGRNIDSNKSDTDGLTCPICYEAWTDGGDHKVCCLPCGHLFGWSCITKWLKNRRSHGKCPQCNQVSKLKDVRILYVNRVCVADEELRERLRSLEAKCADLEQKRLDKSMYLEIMAIMKEMQLKTQTHQLETRTYHQECFSEFESQKQQWDAIIYNQGVSRYQGDWIQHNQERYYAFVGFKCTPYQVPPPYQLPTCYRGPPGAPPIPVYDRDAALAQIQQSSDISDKAGPSGFKSTSYQVPLRYWGPPAVPPGPVYDRDAALAEIQSRHQQSCGTAGSHPSEPEPSHYPWEYFS